MSIEIQCMTEKLIVITIKLDYSKVPSKSTVPTYDGTFPAWWSWQAVLNISHNSVKFQLDSIILASLKAICPLY